VIFAVYSEPRTTGTALTILGSYVYVIGTMLTEEGDLLWLAEKRRVSDLGLVRRYTYDPSPVKAVPQGSLCCIDFHYLTNTLWVVGYSDTKVS